MILWSQQINEISSVFFSFQKGERVNIVLDSETQERDKIFLNPSKFENMTLGNFKIMLYYHMYYTPSVSKIKFLEALSKYNKEKIIETGKLRRDIQSYNYIIENDMRKLTTLDITPYTAFKQGLIHPFTLHKCYKDSKEIVGGRIMAMDIKRVNTLMMYFKVKDANG